MKEDQTKQNVVILVDEHDNEIGLMPKMEAHVKGKLHRAISVFAYDSEGNWIIQQRANDKYHSQGLWSNTCCSHPYQNEISKEAASRRLIEEMGMSGTPSKVFNFKYKAELDNNLIEHELDHIFILQTDETPKPNPDEVQNWKKIKFNRLQEDIGLHPENYTEWFKMLFQEVQSHIIKSTTLVK
ncbi:isopentenyl-diphosphate Delta-isomerase [Reichenbachiella versicolor]|uniref:isopentenyl-diphosphate Delta-isomerase n=1 Tax=Reichenbachiella versicolor TaxID=1821036 RepID=UPI000D6E2136|nr:isopentenyl-diphosphate Delta-isomerase [Reichenbachiella versicolor]